MLRQTRMVIPMPRRHLPSEGRNLLRKGVLSPSKHPKDFQRQGHPLGPGSLLKNHPKHQSQQKALHLCHPKTLQPLFLLIFAGPFTQEGPGPPGAGQAGSPPRTPALQDLCC